MRSRALVLLLLLALTVVPAMAARAEPVDPRIHADAAPCFAHLGQDPSKGPTGTTTCVVAYVHVDDWFRNAMNLQRPPDGLTPVEVGFGMPTISGLYDFNRFRFELDAGPVHYGTHGPQTTNDPYTTAPLDLHDDVPIRARIHLTVDQAPDAVAHAAPGAGHDPCIVVAAQLFHGERDGMERVTTPLTEGRQVAALSRPGLPLPPAPCATGGAYTIDERGITTVDIDIPPITRHIAAGDHLWVEVSTYGIEQDGTRVGLPGVRLYQDGTHLNHVVFPLMDALRIEDVHGLWHERLYYVALNASSPFGGYDIDETTFEARLFGEDGTEIDVRPHLQPPLVRRSHCPHCDDPVRFTVPFDLLAADLPDGTYRLALQVDNSQGTARIQDEHVFSVEDAGTRFVTFDADHEPVASYETGFGRAPPVSKEPFFLASFVVVALLGLLVAAVPWRRR